MPYFLTGAGGVKIKASRGSPSVISGKWIPPLLSKVVSRLSNGAPGVKIKASLGSPSAISGKWMPPSLSNVVPVDLSIVF